MAVQAQTAPMAVLVNQGPNINGEIKGSIQQMQPASVNLNSGAVITGNLYVPGTPGLNKNGSPSFQGIESNGGSTSPTNYWITLNSGSQLGYLVEQTNPVVFSPVANPPAPTGNRSVNVSQGSGSVSSQIGSWSSLRDLNLNSNVGAVSVPAGNYGTFNANAGTSFILGTAGATTPSTYTFSSLTLNSSSNLTLLGPVVIVVQNSVSINSSCVFGNSINPTWLDLQIAQNGLTINSGGTLYGAVEAPTSSINVNGTLIGGIVSCNSLTVNSGGIVEAALSDSPSVAITSPANGTVVQQNTTVSIQASASDAAGTITGVVFYENNGSGTVKIGSSTTSPYSVSWINPAAGTYALTAVATNSSGVSTTSSPVTLNVNAAPSLIVSAPSLIQAGSNLLIKSGATESTGSISLVQFYANNQLIGQSTTSPYSYTWNNVAAGTYSITVKATNNQGGVTTSSPIVVKAVLPPLISISAPANGTNIQSPSNVTIQALASSPNTGGSIAKVDFYEQSGTTNVKLATSTTAPYSYTWTSPGTGPFTLTAVATDNNGFTTTSSPVSIFVNLPPTLAVTTSATNGVVLASSGLSITSGAKDALGTITGVKFFAGSQLIGTVTSAPFNFNWTNPTPGTYQITVTATDNHGGVTTSAPVSVTVAQLPMVAISAPVAGATIQAPANVVIAATASTPNKGGTIAKVDFYENNGTSTAKLGTSTTTPYSFTWASPPLGAYTLTAVATDNYGFTTTSATVAIFVNQPPTENVTTSATKGVVISGGSLLITSGAKDAVGTITNVRFFANGQLIGTVTSGPFNYTWTNLKQGTYQITVTATDNHGGVTTSAPVPITVDQPPTVAITSPPTGTQVQNPANVALTATAASPDTNGSIAKVDFFANSGSGPTLIGEVTQAPYNFTWSSPAAGTYAITAVATDNLGITTTSAPISVQVFGWTTLTEGTKFLSEYSVPVQIPAQPGSFSIEFKSLKFDTTAQGQNKDAFELALVNSSGLPVGPVIASGHDAFYNQSEASTPALAEGVSTTTDANGVTTVTVNIPNVLPGSSATLIARLVNNDTDTATTVQVSQMFNLNANLVAPQTSIDPTEPTETTPLDLTQLQDLSSQFALNFSRSSHNDQATTYYVGLSLKNTSQYLFKGGLAVVVSGISDPSIKLANADGTTEDGFSYIDFTPAVPNDQLASQATTLTRSLAFLNPNHIQFTYHLTVLGDPDHPPVYSSTPGSTAYIGLPFTANDPATDADKDGLTYSLVDGPSGLMVNSSTGAISWTPGSSTQAGSYSYTVGVSDGRGGSTTQTDTVTVQQAPPNSPPVFTSVPNIQGTVGTAYSYPVVAVDPDGRTLTYSVVSGPTGLAINSSTGVVSWTPSASGVSSVVLQVSDGAGNTAQQSYQISVQPVAGDTPPVFVSPTQPTLTVSTNQAPPAGLTPAQAAIYNNLLSTAPVPAPGLVLWMKADQGLAQSNGLVTSWTDQSPYGFIATPPGTAQAPTVGTSPGSTVPAVVFNRNGPDYLQNFSQVNAPHDVTFFAVASTNDTSDFAYIVALGLDYNFGTERGIAVRDNQSEFDVFHTSYQTGSAIPLNQTAISSETFNSSNSVITMYVNGQQTGTPGVCGDSGNTIANYPLGNAFSIGGLQGVQNWNGTISELMVYNRLLSASEIQVVNSYLANKYSLSVPNQLPVTANVISNPITYTYSAQAVSSTGLALTYSLLSGPAGATVNPTTGAVSWSPNVAGTYNFQIQVTDSKGGTSIQSYSIPFSGGGLGTISGYVFNDADGTGVMGSGSSSQPGLSNWIVYEDLNNDGQFDIADPYTTTASDGSYSLANLAAGAYNIRVAPQPGFTQTAPLNNGAQSLTVAAGQQYNEINFGVQQSTSSQPTFTSQPSLSTSVGTTYQYQAVVQDPYTVTYSLQQGPSGMVIDPVTGIVVYAPTANQVGEQTVSIRAQDTQGSSVAETYQLKVLAADIPPVFATIPPTQGVVNQPYQYQMRAQDPAQDAITYALVQGPAGAVIDSSGYLDYTPTAVGSYPIEISATDPRNSTVTQSYVLNVVASATPTIPTITSQPAPTVRYGESYNYIVTVNNPDALPLNYALTQTPAGATLGTRSGGDTPPGFLTWAPTAAQLGLNSFTITVTDGRDAPITQTFTVNVLGVSTAFDNPAITSTPPSGATLNDTYSYNITAVDPDGLPIAYQLEQGPTGMSLDNFRGTLRWVPTANQLGPQTVTVEALNDRGGSSLQTFTITVNSVDEPPLIYSYANTLGAINSAYTYTVGAFSPEGNPLTYSLTQAPTGMVINPTTGVITWTPTSAATVPVTIQVADNQGGSAVQSYNLVVGTTPLPQPPSITTTPQLGANPNSSYSQQLTATDPNGLPVTYTLQSGPAGLTVSSTGLITWQTGSVGTDPIVIVATDSNGGTAVLSYVLNVALDSPPVFAWTPQTVAFPGVTVIDHVSASDPQQNPLSYSLTQAPSGMTIDATGKIIWPVPSTATAGSTYPVTVMLNDGRGGTATKSYIIKISVDTVPPTINLVETINLVDLGRTVSFQVTASDPVGLQNVVLTVDGVALPLNNNNIATTSFSTEGVHAIVATATNVAGLTATATNSVRAINPTDGHFPTITFDKTNLQAVNGIISSPTPIVATINDTNLTSYEVDVAPIDQIDQTNVAAPNAAYKIIATGTANVSDSQVATLDPTVLDNGTYFVRIFASNANGNSNAQGLILTVSGNLKLGRFFYSTTDLNVPLAGIPIQITRTYDTLTSGYNGDFGYGWTLSGVEARVQTSQPKSQSELLGVPDIFSTEGGSFHVGTTVTITGPDGKRETFTFQPVFAGGGFFGAYYRAAYQPEQGVYDTLTTDTSVPLQLNGDGSVGGYLLNTSYEPSDFILTTKDGHVYHYTPSGGLVDEHDRNGVSLTFTHTGIFSSTGASISFTRDPVTDRISAITDPNGNQITYGYDSNGNLISETDQAGRKSQYSYLTTPAHYLNQILDANGNPVAKTAYDGSGRLSTSTDALGNITTFIYSASAMTQTKIEPLDPTTNTNPTVVTFYDSNGNVIQTTNEIGAVSTTTYDANNNPLVVIPPCGCKTTYTYDSNGNPLTRKDSMGNTVSNTYDSNNNITQQLDARGNATYYQYDSNGNLISVIDPTGSTNTFLNDALGRALSSTDALGRTTTFQYIDDPNTAIAANKPSIVMQPDGSTIQFTYDSFGSVTSIVDENGNKTSLVVDNAGILQQKIQPNGSVTSYAYDDNGNLISAIDSLGNKTQMKYDLASNLIERDGPNGEVTTFTYDQVGRLSNMVNPLGQETTRHYRSDGVVQSITEPNNTTIIFDNDTNGRRTGLTDPAGNHSTVTYNSNSQVLTRTDALGKTKSYTYDPNGNIVKVTDRLGRVRSFVYDSDNRIISEDWFSSQNALIKTISTQYDANGNTINTSDDAGTFAIQYDVRGRMTELTTNYTGQQPFNLNYAYDGGSRITSITDEDGVQVSNSYDQEGNVSNINWTGPSIGIHAAFTHDSLGNLTNINRYSDLSATSLISQSTLQYSRALSNLGYQAAVYNTDDSGTQTSPLLQQQAVGPLLNDADSGSLLQELPQPLSTLGQIIHQDGGGNTINSEIYSFNKLGQLVEKTTGLDGIQFSYDQANQLLSATHSSSTNSNESYGYDISGNRISDSSQTSNSIISGANRLVNNSLNTYLYDDEGNLTSQTEIATGDEWIYAYDLRNRMTSATKVSNKGTIETTVQFTYDALNRRIQKVVDGEPLSFFYERNNIWKSVDSAVNVNRYLTGTSDDQWLATSTNSGIQWYLSDRLGSIVNIVDNTGKSLVSNVYDTFGNRVSQNIPQFNESRGFEGREYDEETGLYYFKARYYAPQMGRFLSEDPIGFDSGDFNRYRFVFNSPLNYTDRKGTDVVEYTEQEYQDRSTLYVLRNKASNVVDKIGQSCDFINRYSQAYLDAENVYIDPIISGPYSTILFLENRLLRTCKVLPRLNKTTH